MVKQRKIYSFRRNSVAFNFASMALLLMELSFKGNFPYFVDRIVANHSTPEEKKFKLAGICRGPLLYHFKGNAFIYTLKIISDRGNPCNFLMACINTNMQMRLISQN